MAVSANGEKSYRLKCEKVVNETWSKVERYKNEIEQVLNKEILTDRDISLLRIAADAFLQKVKLDQADDKEFFGVDLSKSDYRNTE